MTNKEAAFILSDNCCDYSTEELRTAFDLAIKALEERPQGKWIMEDKLYGGYGDRVLVSTCSICKTSFIYHGKTHNFCPNCGADMRGDKNE